MLLVSFGVFLAVVSIVGVGIVRQRPRSNGTVLYLFGAALFLGGVLNFAAFWHMSVHLGGDALAGRVVDGKYFLASHGKVTEVSEATWRYSHVHAKSIPLTHVLGGVGIAIMCVIEAWSKKHAT
jgi:hypothetical protein